MPRRHIQFLAENYYHIFNRWNNQQKIFLEPENYRFFLERLHRYYAPVNIDLIAYRLMPNHFHLLIYLQREVDFSNIMRSFSVSYIKSFNRWHQRVGHLFQGDFQARLINADNYLSHVCRYIHLNPVKAKLVKFPEDWKYSDYRAWIENKNSDFSQIRNAARNRNSISANIRTRKLLFGTATEYKKFVMDFADEQNKQSEIERLLFG